MGNCGTCCGKADPNEVSTDKNTKDLINKEHEKLASEI